MRQLADKVRIDRFMQALAGHARTDVRLYFTGGSTAVLFGWRASTIDIDIRFIPERDELFRALPKLKEELQINVELASPDEFIPELPGWQDRSVFITRIGKISFYHYDPYSQTLSKIERGHSQDRSDVEKMIESGLVERTQLLAYFEAIEPDLYRYPAIDPKSFRRAVETVAVYRDDSE
ncbi:MAG: DUF6036 family nucleotidyltransferase [Vicinamibacteria bacterium]